MDELKRCSTCKIPKRLSDFHRDARRPDGLQTICKECRAKVAARYRQGRKSNWKRFENDPEGLRAKKREADRKYRERHRDKCRAYAREAQRKRCVLVKSAEGSFTAAEWKELCDHYGNVCLCCGQAKPLTVDHVIPLSKGGSNYISNIQPLCHSCNSSKGDSHIDYR